MEPCSHPGKKKTLVWARRTVWAVIPAQVVTPLETMESLEDDTQLLARNKLVMYHSKTRKDILQSKWDNDLHFKKNQRPIGYGAKILLLLLSSCSSSSCFSSSSSSSSSVFLFFVLQLLGAVHLSRTAAFIVTLQCYKDRQKKWSSNGFPYLRTPSAKKKAEAFLLTMLRASLRLLCGCCLFGVFLCLFGCVVLFLSCVSIPGRFSKQSLQFPVVDRPCLVLVRHCRKKNAARVITTVYWHCHCWTTGSNSEKQSRTRWDKLRLSPQTTIPASFSSSWIPVHLADCMNCSDMTCSCSRTWASVNIPCSWSTSNTPCNRITCTKFIFHIIQASTCLGRHWSKS